MEATQEARPDIEELDRPEKSPEREAVDRVANASAKGVGELAKDEPETVKSAMDWFLSDEVPEASEYTKTLRVNVGPPAREEYVEWTFRPIDADEMLAINRSLEGNRQQRRRGGNEVDVARRNRLIVVQASVNPDFAQIASAKGIADPSEVLRARLGHKPGVIDQLAAEILTISGYDDEDLRDPKEQDSLLRAAGN